MYGHQRFMPDMYWQSPYEQSVYPTVPYPVVPVVVDWYNEWPRTRSILLAVTLILSGMAIIGLDIANLAIEGNKSNETARIGLGTDKVAAGVWSGSTVVLAAGFILAVVFARNKQMVATFALFATILASLFMIVLLGLIGNSIQVSQYMTDRTDVDRLQEKLLLTILALAAFVIILCMVYFIFYIRVLFSFSTRARQKYQY